MVDWANHFYIKIILSCSTMMKDCPQYGLQGRHPKEQTIVNKIDITEIGVGLDSFYVDQIYII
jgi:hypothetical protein